MNKQLGDKRRNIQVEGLRGGGRFSVWFCTMYFADLNKYTPGWMICILNHSEGWVF